MSFFQAEYVSHDLDTGETIKVFSFDDCLKAMKRRYQDAEVTIERLTEENKRLKSEHYQNEELKRMQAELSTMRRDLYRGFPIEEKTLISVRDWQKEHDISVHAVGDEEKCLTKANVLGPDYVYEFVPTPIGTFGTVKCAACGAKFEFQKP